MFALCMRSQDYTARWANVLKYEQEGLTQKAMLAADSIYRLAETSRNEPQIIKSFFFRSKYLMVLNENAGQLIFESLAQERKVATLPTKAILESVYATMLTDVYNDNRYVFDSRTNITAPTVGDFSTWTGKHFNAEIDAAWKRSLAHREELYKVPLTQYREIIDFGESSSTFERSLYDFLAGRYLDASRYKLNITNPEKIFGVTLQAEALDIAGGDDKSALTEKLLFCRDLEEFYLRKKDALHYQNSVLRRLRFTYNSLSNNYSANAPYLATLNALSEEWKDSYFAWHARFASAELYYRMADKERAPENLKTTLSITNEILRKGKTDLYANAFNLKRKILEKTFSLITEQYVPPGKPSLAFINYKNADSVLVRIYKTNRTVFTDPEKKRDYYSMARPKPVTEKWYRLNRKADDYFEHSAEIILPALPNGFYSIEAYINGEAQNKINNLIQVTSSTLQADSDSPYGIYYARNIETGAPCKDAYALHKNVKSRADAQGAIRTAHFEKNPREQNTFVVISGKDTLISGRYRSYYHNYEDEDEKRVNVQLYLDRAIYRPGQTVYFKGIVTQQRGKKLSLVKDIFVHVEITDAAGKEASVQRLPVNKMGSFTGTFIIPKDGLTGQFDIEVDEDEGYEEDEHPFWDDPDLEFRSASESFNVEEYKRPTFEVTLQQPKGDLLFNKQVIIEGVAKSFSGAPIAGSSVKYAVTGSSEFLTPNKAVDNDEVQTGDDGSFTICFTPKKENDQLSGQEIFQAVVTVTDSRGEVRQANLSITVGGPLLRLSIAGPSNFIDPQVIEVPLTAKNNNNELKAVNGTLTMYLVEESETPVLSRHWPEPEEILASEKEFNKWFPYLSYHKEKPVHRTQVFSRKVAFTGEGKVEVPASGLGYGRYELEFEATDSNGEKNDVSRTIEIARNGLAPLAEDGVFSYIITNTDFAKDGFVALTVSTPLDALHTMIKYNEGSAVKVRYMIIGPKPIAVKIPVTQPGYLEIVIETIWQNRSFSESKSYFIQDTKPQLLPIEPVSITSKLSPGNPVQWTFNVKRGNVRGAEVLASMYDASLDSFTKSNWQLPYIQQERVDLSSSEIQTRGTDRSTYTPDTKFLPVPLFDDHLYMYGFSVTQANKYFLYKNFRNPGKGGNTIQVTGTVKDVSGMPIPGVMVTVDGTVEGVQTDFDGVYTIYVPKLSRLTFSYVGMVSVSLPAQAVIPLDVVLTDDAMALDDVVVEAYRSITKSTSNVSAVTIINSPNATFLQTLQGQIPGLNIASGNGQPGGGTTVILRGAGSISGNPEPLFVIDGVPMTSDQFRALKPDDIAQVTVITDASGTALYGNRGANGVIVVSTKNAVKALAALQEVQARKNFSETAFFYPHLTTGKDGNVDFGFTTPDALTRWKLRMVAHDRNAMFGYYEEEFVSQKELMVVPNMPRFLREGDNIVLMAKITNLTGEAKEGTAMLQLANAVTLDNADAATGNTGNMKTFNLPANGSVTVSWQVKIPLGMEGLQYKIAAKAGNYTDGEENILPVLPNRIMVTESQPLWVKPGATKSFTIENLKTSASSTRVNHGLTLQYSASPVWTAVESLPYLMEFEHECAEQLFSRYYANALAGHILEANPKIKKVMEEWRKSGNSLGRLEQNPELKSALMAETPWVLDTADEAVRNNRVALLFDLDKMKNTLDATFKKLRLKQQPGGGFVWFEGGSENPYITRHIIAGFGHLQKLGAAQKSKELDDMITSAVKYIDDYYKQQYTFTGHTSVPHSLGVQDIHYLYARSFYLTSLPADEALKNTIGKSVAALKKDWLSLTLYEKAMAAITLKRMNEPETARKIIDHLKDSAATNEEYGMYWIANKPGWYWYNAPIEVQAMLIEAFAEVANDTASVEAMKVWLVRQKQKSSWPTTKATTEAIYALLLQGSDWTAPEGKESISIVVNGTELAAAAAETEMLRKSWSAKEVDSRMATVTIHNNTKSPGYGGYYWQYFEDLDKIKDDSSGVMHISKELYRKATGTDRMLLEKVSAGSPLKVGDLATIRLKITVGEDMEYVHLKDLRASSFEPVDVISGYHWSEGLGYYRSTRDAATHFFFDRIPRGTYILEYDVRVNNAGEFSDGITTLQSMYAPEFSAHSKGAKVTATP